MVNWAEEKEIQNYEVVTLLRDPIERAISHFNFIKTQSWVSAWTPLKNDLSVLCFLKPDRRPFNSHTDRLKVYVLGFRRI